MYDMMTIANNTVLHIWKLLREKKILKFLTTREKFFLIMWADEC